VVFGSYEEASESLSMNGRALNDRAIEVSPSSSRVLDRAAHSQPPGGPPLLTPFPPSKNRPRPGDWTCPSCGFSNFQRRTACFRCSFPAMGASAPDPYNQSYNMQHGPYGGSGYGHPNMMGNHMHGGGSSYGGGMGGSSGGRGGIVPFRAGDWKCGNEGCGYHNFAKNVSCLRCGASRSNAAVVADNGMTSFPGSNYGAPPQHMQPMQSMDHSTPYAGIQPPPGASYGSAAMPGPPAAYQNQSYGPPSGYSTAPQGGPYMAAHTGGYSHASNGHHMHSQGGFDSRAEQAFNQSGSTSGAGSYSNGSGATAYGHAGGHYGTHASEADFSFLSTGMGHLGIAENDGRRNGQGNNKSPQ